MSKQTEIINTENINTENKENTMSENTAEAITTTEATEEKKPAALKLSEIVKKYAEPITTKAIREHFNIPDGTKLNPITYEEATEKPWRLYSGCEYVAFPVTFIVAKDYADSIRYMVARELQRVAKSKDSAEIMEAVYNAAEIVINAGAPSRVVVPDDEATKADY